LRAETEYRDAWVFDGAFGETPPVAAVIEPIIEKKEEPVVEVKPLEPETKPAIDSTALVKPVERPIDPIVETKPVGKPFYFKLINVADNSEVKSGEVHVQEVVRATQYQAFKPGEVVYLEAPKNKRGTYSVVTEVPGYSQLSSVFNYQNPPGEKGGNGEVIIELPVKKAKKGDYVDFRNVKFFKNSSILEPESQNELDGLVDLMRENLKYKIKIHGHVNGTQSRECFVRGTNSIFFVINPSTYKKERNLSSKDLSNLRAETVKDYLVSQGIDASRLTTKGEGGKIPLYPESGSLGSLNDRIEIEFTKN
jgi:outer membrane protein OmpA-like peptidoglycan-associated protein